MRTEYITVRMTVKEAEALLTMAASGDYQVEDSGFPALRNASNRAESKIRRALIAKEQEKTCSTGS